MAETPEEARARRLRQAAETGGSIAPSRMSSVEGPNAKPLDVEWRAGGVRRVKAVAWMVWWVPVAAAGILAGMRAIAVFVLACGMDILGLATYTAVTGVAGSRRRRRSRRSG
jgi:hypothetical protein